VTPEPGSGPRCRPMSVRLCSPSILSPTSPVGSVSAGGCSYFRGIFNEKLFYGCIKGEDPEPFLLFHCRFDPVLVPNRPTAGLVMSLKL
jgi:hypothetical protein